MSMLNVKLINIITEDDYFTFIDKLSPSLDFRPSFQNTPEDGLIMKLLKQIFSMRLTVY